MTDHPRSHALPDPGPLEHLEVADRIEVRVTGQPPPMLDDDGVPIAGFPPYDFTFRTDRTDAWASCATIAARALTQWDSGHVQIRRVQVTTRTSDWTPVPLEQLLQDGGAPE